MSRLRPWAETHGWDVVFEHVEAETGTNLDRPGYRRLMGEARGNRLDVVAVCKVDRLSRSIVDFVGTTEELHRLGVRIVAIDQGVDVGPEQQDPSSALVMHVMAAFAQWEAAMIQSRTKDGIAHYRALNEGRWGRRPVHPDRRILEAIRQNSLGVPWSTLAQQLGMRSNSLQTRARRLRRRMRNQGNGEPP